MSPGSLTGLKRCTKLSIFRNIYGKKPLKFSSFELWQSNNPVREKNQRGPSSILK